MKAYVLFFIILIQKSSLQEIVTEIGNNDNNNSITNLKLNTDIAENTKLEVKEVIKEEDENVKNNEENQKNNDISTIVNTEQTSLNIINPTEGINIDDIKHNEKENEIVIDNKIENTTNEISNSKDDETKDNNNSTQNNQEAENLDSLKEIIEKSQISKNITTENKDLNNHTNSNNEEAIIIHTSEELNEKITTDPINIKEEIPIKQITEEETSNQNEDNNKTELSEVESDKSILTAVKTDEEIADKKIEFSNENKLTYEITNNDEINITNKETENKVDFQENKLENLSNTIDLSTSDKNKNDSKDQVDKGNDMKEENLKENNNIKIIRDDITSQQLLNDIDKIDNNVIDTKKFTDDIEINKPSSKAISVINETSSEAINVINELENTQIKEETSRNKEEEVISLNNNIIPENKETVKNKNEIEKDSIKDEEIKQENEIPKVVNESKTSKEESKQNDEKIKEIENHQQNIIKQKGEEEITSKSTDKNKDNITKKQEENEFEINKINKQVENQEEKSNFFTEDEHSQENNIKVIGEDEDDDNLARNAFIITLIFLVAFIFAFIYNLIKCYVKHNQNSQLLNAQFYSRELEMSSSINDDTVLDLDS